MSKRSASNDKSVNKRVRISDEVSIVNVERVKYRVRFCDNLIAPPFEKTWAGRKKVQPILRKRKVIGSDLPKPRPYSGPFFTDIRHLITIDTESYFEMMEKPYFRRTLRSNRRHIFPVEFMYLTEEELPSPVTLPAPYRPPLEDLGTPPTTPERSAKYFNVPSTPENTERVERDDLDFKSFMKSIKNECFEDN